MYAKCGDFQRAKDLLDKYKSKDVFSWTALISAYARHGHNEEALVCFERMKHEGLFPDAVTYACTLRACGNMRMIDLGEQIHDEITRQGLVGNDAVLATALVDMYAKCGALTKAEHVLDGLPSRGLTTWNALIKGYAEQGQGAKALDAFERMRCEGFSPSEATFTIVLKVCAAMKAMKRGQQIHQEVIKHGWITRDVMLGTALVDMYAKGGDIKKAHQLVVDLPTRDAICWSALIAGYTQQGQCEQALTCFEEMQSEGLSPNAVTFTCVLNACGYIGDVQKGEQIHDEITRRGLLEENIMLGTAIVDMYANCGALTKARRLFDELPSRNVVSWNSLIAKYIQHGECELALNCFEQMQGEGLHPDAVTFMSILKACGTIGDIDKGEQIHDEIKRLSLLRHDLLLGSAVIDMYAKCGALKRARGLLEELPCRDGVSWNSLITGYAQFGHNEEVLNCYQQMQCEGLCADKVTFISILKACGNLNAVCHGERIHDEILRQDLLRHDSVLGSALVDMYVKCGDLAKAEQVLNELPVRNAVSWSSLIVGYTQYGLCEQAWHCYERMQAEGLSPDAVTYTSILKACSSMGAVIKGEHIHNEVRKQGWLGNDIILGTALVDMYIKCGALAKAQALLEELPHLDVVLWNTLITGYVQQGEIEHAFNCFEQMQKGGFCPDAVTLSAVLSGCSHLGRVEDAYKHFIEMITQYGIKPDLEHYTCMVDLLGRAGHLDKAVRVIQEMPSSDCSILCALLSACRTWKDINVGRWAFQQAVEIDRNDGAAYILMADIYAAVGLQEEAATVEAMRRENLAWK
ncbi:hypothetical protein KP509_10G022300 [Ceratopteris richardii]|nr:hypothetical protein KP509_10G022300 [Ceratopteris richardii]